MTSTLARACLGVALATLTLGACPPDHAAREAMGGVERCTEEGQRCKMGGSKLGICSTLPSGAMTCQSQH